MRTLRVLIVLGLVALIAAFVGCSDETKVVNEGGLTLDQQAVTDLVNQASEFEHDVVSHAVPDTTATLAPGAAAPEARFWWRQYSARNRQVTVNTFPADVDHTYPRAEVTVQTTFTGFLHVVHRDTGGAYTRTSQAISDVFTQYATFEQWFSDMSPNRGWQCTQISNILGGPESSSLDIATVDVNPATSEGRLYSSESFMTQYNPTTRMDLQENEQVYLMAQSGSGTNRLFRHDWADGQAARVELSNQDLGFYSDNLTTPTPLSAAQAQRHLVIDAIAPGVIESGATYDAIIWAIPYVINTGGDPN
jgi:hypothetical protein